MNTSSQIPETTQRILDGSLEEAKQRAEEIRLVAEYFLHTGLISHTKELELFIAGQILAPDSLTFASLYIAFQGTKDFGEDTFVRKEGEGDFQEITYDEFVAMYAKDIPDLPPRSQEDQTSESDEQYSAIIFREIHARGFIQLSQVASSYMRRFSDHMRGFTL